MKRFLLPENGNSYKANLHCHSILSDGRKSPEEIKELYKKLGYSVVAYTDHDIFITHNELTDDTFLALNGFEAEVNGIRKEGDNETLTCHVCYIALESDKEIHPFWHRERYLFSNAVNYRDQVKFDENEPDYVREYSSKGISDMMQKGRTAGFFVTYNHPTWSVEDYRHYMGYVGMNAFEMFNGACNSTGYEDFNPRVYDDILRGGNRIYCIGADDNHNFYADDTPRCDSGWAFTVIKANKLDYRTVTKALEDGNFYASEGPEIHELWYEDGKVHIKCSDAYRINLNTDIRHANTVIANEGESVTEATFGIPQQSKYFRLTVVDRNGKHACTNAYFLDELN